MTYIYKDDIKTLNNTYWIIQAIFFQSCSTFASTLSMTEPR